PQPLRPLYEQRSRAISSSARSARRLLLARSSGGDGAPPRRKSNGGPKRPRRSRACRALAEAVDRLQQRLSLTQHLTNCALAVAVDVIRGNDRLCDVLIARANAAGATCKRIFPLQERERAQKNWRYLRSLLESCG